MTATSASQLPLGCVLTLKLDHAKKSATQLAIVKSLCSALAFLPDPPVNSISLYSFACIQLIWRFENRPGLSMLGRVWFSVVFWLFVSLSLSSRPGRLSSLARPSCLSCPSRLLALVSRLQALDSLPQSLQSLTPSLTHSLTHSLTQSLSLSISLPLSLGPSLPLSLSPSLSISLPLSLALYLSPSLPRSLSLSLSLSFIPKRPRTLSGAWSSTLPRRVLRATSRTVLLSSPDRRWPGESPSRACLVLSLLQNLG